MTAGVVFFLLLVLSAEVKCDGTLQVDLQEAKHTLSDTFLSVTLDMSVIRWDWMTFDFDSVRLQNMAKGISPAILRVGGTSADFLIFTPESRPTEKKKHTNFTLYGNEWEKLHKFTSDAGWDMLFDLNVLLRKGEEWDETNAVQLLQYSQERGYKLDFQLGNEPNLLDRIINETFPSDVLAKSYIKLKEVLQDFPLYKDSILVGPEISSPKSKDGPLSSSERYLKEFIDVAREVVDAASFHMYYLDGKIAQLEDFLNTTVLEKLPVQITRVQKIIQDLQLSTPVWISETSSAHSSGAPGLSDAFVAGFNWLDKLGVCSNLGVGRVMRQSFYNGAYALINKQLDPLPDYWLTLIYKQLIGSEVLEAQLTGEDIDGIRLYAGCSRQSSLVKSESGSVVVYGMNLNNKAMSVELPKELTMSEKQQYRLHSCSGYLTDQCVKLNGEPLSLVDDELPILKPKTLKPSSTLELQPHSLYFWSFPQVKSSVCK